MHQQSYHPTPRRLSWRLTLALALVLALTVACLFLFVTVRQAVDPDARAAAELARYRQQALDDQLQPLDTVVAAGWRVLPFVVVGFGLALVWRRWGHHRYIEAHHVTQLTKASVQRFPAGLHSLSFHDSSRPQMLPPPEVEATQPLLPALPTFAALLDRGRVGKGNPLLLGFDVESGQELTGSWLDLYSTAVSGMPGSGKTTSQRFLACQTALHGARFAICDPHAGAADDSLASTLAPLAAAFVCEPASSDKAILDVVRYVADVGKRRVEGKDDDVTPLILWVDELTALLGRSTVAAELGGLMERIAQEYRKRHVFLCASGQIWTAARTTSELRDSFASVLCHRMKRSQARLLLPTDEAEQVERLPTGRAVLWRTSGATSVISVPNTTAQDVQRVAGLLTAGQPTLTLATPRHTAMPERSQNVAWNMPDAMPTGSQRVASDDLAYSAAASAEARRAATLFFDGMDLSQIVYELRGVKSNEGKRYQTALAEVQRLVREGGRG